MTTAEVRRQFGAPEGKSSFQGCEFDPESRPSVVWEWLVGGGKVQLTFDGVDGRLGSYRTESPSLSTTLGDHAGESFSKVRARWGKALKPVNLGAPSTPESGPWYAGDPATAELLFQVRNGQSRIHHRRPSPRV